MVLLGARVMASYMSSPKLSRPAVGSHDNDAILSSSTDTSDNNSNQLISDADLNFSLPPASSAQTQNINGVSSRKGDGTLWYADRSVSTPNFQDNSRGVTVATMFGSVPRRSASVCDVEGGWTGVPSIVIHARIERYSREGGP